MVGADAFSFWPGHFFAGTAHSALSDDWWYALRRALLHGARCYRTEIRHGPRAVTGHVFGFRPTAGARLVTLFHVAALQTYAAERDSGTRIFAERRQFRPQFRPPNFWSEEGRDRHYLLGAIFQLLDEEDWRYSTDTGWNEWDIQIYGNFWWSIALQTVTEYHGGAKCLTRVRLRDRLVTTTVIFNLIALSLLIYRQLNASHIDFWFIIPYSLFLVFLGTRARVLKSRVAELVDLAAHRAGLQRVARRGKVPTSRSTLPVQALMNATESASSYPQ